MNDHEYMNIALQLASRAASAGEVPVGAVVVVDGQVIAEGHNQPISTNDPTAHAEIVAIRQAASVMNNYRLTGATLYVTLEPCPMCFAAMVHARIKRLVFAAHDSKVGITKYPSNHEIEIAGGVCEARASDLLKSFFASRRRCQQQQTQ